MNSFFHTLGYSLLADYFNVSFMTTNGRGKDLKMLCSKDIFFHFQPLLASLNSDINIFEYTKNESFLWIEFTDLNSKELVEDYFINFNLQNRSNFLIVLPDLYEGEKDAKQEICNWYLQSIEECFKNDLDGAAISIPFGISEDDPSERMFMLYEKDGLKGLYKGSDVFDKSLIRYINFKS
jgi:hypothetical protein